MSRPLQLRLTETAEADLANVWAYAASEAFADRLIARIEAGCASVRDFPLAGPSREHLAPSLRVIIIEKDYAIYYRHDDREIVIVRVLHGARDAAVLAERGGFP